VGNVDIIVSHLQIAAMDFLERNESL